MSCYKNGSKSMDIGKINQSSLNVDKIIKKENKNHTEQTDVQPQYELPNYKAYAGHLVNLNPSFKGSELSFEEEKQACIKKAEEQGAWLWLGGEEITKENLSLCKEILSDEKICSNGFIQMGLSELLHITQTQEVSEARVSMIKLLRENDLLESEDDISGLIDILKKILTQENVEAQNAIIQAIKNQKIFDNYNYNFIMRCAISSTSDKESANAKISFLEYFKEKPELQKIDTLTNSIGFILLNTNTAESANAKINLLNNIKDNADVTQNQDIMSDISVILQSTHTLEESENKINVINCIIKNKVFLDKHPALSRTLDYLLCKDNDKEAVNAQIQLINHFANNETILENQSINQLANKILSNTGSQDSVDGKILLINYLKENYPNLSKEDTAIPIEFIDLDADYSSVETKTQVQDVAGNIILTTDTQEKAEAKIKLLEYIKANPEIENNKTLYDICLRILSSNQEVETIDIQTNLIKFFDENQEFLENKSLKRALPYIITEYETKESVEGKISFLEYVKANNEIMQIPSFSENLYSFIGDIRNEDTTNGKIKLIEYIKENNFFVENKIFNKQLYLYISNIKSEKQANEKIKVLDYIKNNPDLLNDPYLTTIINHNLKTASKDKTADAVIHIIEYMKSHPNLVGKKKIKEYLERALIDCNTKEEAISRTNFINGVSFLSEYNQDYIFAKYNDFKEYITPYYEKENVSLLDALKNGEITEEQCVIALNRKENIPLKNIFKANKLIDKNVLNKLSNDEQKVAYRFINFCHKKDINELSVSEKKTLLKTLVDSNSGSFNISRELKQMFPLIPTNTKEYCTILPDIVKALGIEIKPLETKEIESFNKSINDLAFALASLSDEDFNNLNIQQQYSQEQFVKDVFNIVKNLDKNERAKVYDYFGFELYNNKNGIQVDENARHKFSITGYPQNLNNGKKLAKIIDPNTKRVVEKLRPYVIKFSQNNIVTSGNTELDKTINQIISLMPELNSIIEKQQHKTHSFSVFKHSLKVMQKITQNPEFEKLNDSDKKLMLLASLLHDIAKETGSIDNGHAQTSSFDIYFICKKFNLTKEEENKLYSLCNYHDWLQFVNKPNTSIEEQTSRAQKMAFHLQYDNLFEMSKIFTQADLKAVKTDDYFYNKYKSALDEKSEIVQNNINKLKKTQPILPITKFPSSSKIKEAITTVNEDGSTNIKGVYLDTNGLIILKYNEIENWEQLGFPQGTKSRGIETTCVDDYGKEHNIDTGNLKFFVHALNYKNQLYKFDAFNLPDSDALLSVSYAERPESKYRFFRTQGVILNIDTQNVHGGGDSDSGSGYGKNINEFISDYAFEDSYRHNERIFIANLIKQATGMNDEEYTKFVENNRNKQMNEIEPKEYRELIIKALATINSNKRIGDREYNEMYGSSPEIMGVFAYPENDYPIGNPIDFVNSKQETFLIDYAIEKDIPYIVFGD